MNSQFENENDKRRVRQNAWDDENEDHWVLVDDNYFSSLGKDSETLVILINFISLSNFF